MFIKITNIKYRGNPSSGSRDDNTHRDGQTDIRNPISTFATKRKRLKSKKKCKRCTYIFTARSHLRSRSKVSLYLKISFVGALILLLVFSGYLCVFFPYIFVTCVFRIFMCFPFHVFLLLVFSGYLCVFLSIYFCYLCSPDIYVFSFPYIF